MSARLTIKTVLANPKRKGAARSKRKVAAKRAARSPAMQWIIRLVTAKRKFIWFTGSSWSHNKSAAKKYPSSSAASRALAGAGNKPQGWIVADVMPA